MRTMLIKEEKILVLEQRSHLGKEHLPIFWNVALQPVDPLVKSDHGDLDGAAVINRILHQTDVQCLFKGEHF